MNIALDYDGTYTRDPKMWDGFISMCKWHGHKIFICTCRGPNPQENQDMVVPAGIECYFTNGQSKAPFMERQGITVHVWIDDMPDMITDGAMLVG